MHQSHRHLPQRANPAAVVKAGAVDIEVFKEVDQPVGLFFSPQRDSRWAGMSFLRIGNAEVLPCAESLFRQTAREASSRQIAVMMEAGRKAVLLVWAVSSVG